MLHAVHAEPGRRLPELAREAGLHVNTAREHLHVLEDEGFVVSRAVATGTRGRPPVVYDPVRSSDENPNAERRLKQSLHRGDMLRRIRPTLDLSADLNDAAQHQVDALYAHLDEVGLEPHFDPQSLQIEVRPCRYHELINEHGEVVCSVHGRLVRQQLEQVPGPLRIVEVLPFVTPHACRVTLASGGRTDEAEEHTWIPTRPRHSRTGAAIIAEDEASPSA
ncbi:helix-turn-helix domain-containing protein [Leucobacter tardus]